jgi:hypothetical protein
LAQNHTILAVCKHNIEELGFPCLAHTHYWRE